MSDPTKVYQGGVPTGGYDEEIKNAGFGVSGEGEDKYVPGKADAPSPKTVSEGGNGGGKTYDKSASEDFLLNSSYKTGLEVAARPTSTDIDNPDDLSHADHNDDTDIPNKKGY